MVLHLLTLKILLLCFVLRGYRKWIIELDFTRIRFWNAIVLGFSEAVNCNCLLFTFTLLWELQFSCRFLASHWCTVCEIGIYMLNFRIGFVFAVLMIFLLLVTDGDCLSKPVNGTSYVSITPSKSSYNITQAHSVSTDLHIVASYSWCTHIFMLPFWKDIFAQWIMTTSQVTMIVKNILSNSRTDVTNLAFVGLETI